MIAQPAPFVVFRERTYLHGTKAQLAPGDQLTEVFSPDATLEGGGHQCGGDDGPDIRPVGG